MTGQRRPARGERVLLLCGSRKPAPTQPGKKSASRELLRYAQRGVRASGADHTWVDLRELDTPLWNGVPAAELGRPDLDQLVAEVRGSRVLLLAAPAYWGGVSGVVKNVIDLLGRDPFEGLVVVPMVVGQDDASAWLGAAQLRTVMATLGTVVAPVEMVVGDPPSWGDPAALIQEAKRLGVYAGMLASGRLALAGTPVAAPPPAVPRAAASGGGG